MYFYNEIAKRLNISVDRVLIEGRHGRVLTMYCPSEFIELQHRTFQVTILNTNVISA